MDQRFRREKLLLVFQILSGCHKGILDTKQWTEMITGKLMGSADQSKIDLVVIQKFQSLISGLAGNILIRT